MRTILILLTFIISSCTINLHMKEKCSTFYGGVPINGYQGLGGTTNLGIDNIPEKNIEAGAFIDGTIHLGRTLSTVPPKDGVINIAPTAPAKTHLVVVDSSGSIQFNNIHINKRNNGN